MTKTAASKRQFNANSLTLWLGAYAGGYTYPREDDGGQQGKRGSRVPVNLVWMQACSDPAVRDSHEVLHRIVIERMPLEHPLAYFLFEYLYLREDANPADRQIWKRRRSSQDKLRLKLLKKVEKWILDEAEKEVEDGVIVVPDPVDPVGFVQISEKAQTVAHRTFWRCVDHVGEVEARKRAAQQSGFSERHVRRLLPPGISQQLREEAS